MPKSTHQEKFKAAFDKIIAQEYNEIIYEYWDGEVKHQSKKRLALLEQAIAQTGAIITDRYEWEIFEKNSLRWRNPLLLKVKLPKGKR